MRPVTGWIVRLSLLLPLALTGCATTNAARYVYQDGEFGVVGLPENTDHWPTHYRQQADALMKAHFPEGYEVVRAEEVIEGSRTLTMQGARMAEIAPALPAALLSTLKIGQSTSRSQADNVKIKECRIIYRRTPSGTQTTAFSDLATLSPTPYVDPNVVERRNMYKPVPPDPQPERDRDKGESAKPHPEEKKGDETRPATPA